MIGCSAVADPTPTLNELQDPLPESNWLWRRIFCFAVTAVLLFFMWGLVDRVGKVAVVMPEKGIPALVIFSKWTIAFAGLVVTYYLLAPSFEQMTKMVKTASLLKSGVQVAARAIHRTPGKVEETSTTVGLPPVAAPETTTTAAPATPIPPTEVTSKKETEILE